MKKIYTAMTVLLLFAVALVAHAMQQDVGLKMGASLEKSTAGDKKARDAQRKLKKEVRERKQAKPEDTVPAEQEPPQIIVADFESYPNNLGGNVGVFGAAEPDWDNRDVPHGWYYNKQTPGYTKKNVHGGEQSFMCVNGYSRERVRWATFSLDLGKLVNAEVIPVKIKSLNVSNYPSLVLWVKGDRGGEKFNVFFRDAHAQDYFPQVSIAPVPNGLTTEWQKIVIPLSLTKEYIDLTVLDQIGLEFGANFGNAEGNIFYLDDVYFSKTDLNEGAQYEVMPKQEDKAQ